MKKLFWGTLLLALMFSSPLPTMAQVNVNFGFSLPLPPAIHFQAPPRMIVLPNTDIYVDPDVNVDIFFNDGWWWRPYQGRWYRSRDYNSGWTHHRQPPAFYREVPRHWKDDYRNHQWKGNRWTPERRDHREVQKNWNYWKKDKHWEKNNNWGVQRAKYNQNDRRQVPQAHRGKNDRDDRNDRNDRNNKQDKYDRNDKNGKHGNH